MSQSAKAKSIVLESDVIGEISKIVMQISGVQLGEKQRTMVEGRLQKRILDLKIANLQEYQTHFHQHRDQEVLALISLLTTHHTYFFREFSHFQYLETSGLKVVADAVRARGEKKIRFWSAACSRGQEVYSLAMFLKQLMPKIAPDLTFEILGTDIDPESIEIAKNGVYHHNEIKEAPIQFITGNWTRGTGEISEYVKARATIKDHCHFEVVNLLNLSLFNNKPDIIFCRNVFIYFTQDQIKEITTSFLKILMPNGLLFIGISESLSGMNLPIKPLGPSIYAKHEAQHKKEITKPIQSPVASAPPLLRVLCVDDSPTVIALLKQILNKTNGFEIVATASNGIEAALRIKDTKIDIMTLDIHMPQQTGLEYLKANMGPSHPPVVMISSVSREDAALAIQCLEAGASDYVEKPAISNLKERGDEICNKLLCSFRYKQTTAKINLSLEKSFAALPTINDPNSCFRLVIASLVDRKKLQHLFNELTGKQPATVILMEGCETALPSFVQESRSSFNGKLSLLERDLSELSPQNIYIADFSKLYETLKSKYSSRRTSILVYGNVTATAENKLLGWNHANIILEDMGNIAKANSLRGIAADIVPATTFAYSSNNFLSKINGQK